MPKASILLLIMFIALAGCASMTVAEKEQKRAELDTMFDAAITSFIQQDPEVADEIKASVGYAVASMKLTKIPVLGGGGGEAVLVENPNQKRAYYSVSRFDIGGGVGARAFKVLMVFNSQEILDKWKTGKWEFKAGAEASAGTASAEGVSESEGFTIRTLSESGASATVTARVLRIKVNKLLSEPE